MFFSGPNNFFRCKQIPVPVPYRYSTVSVCTDACSPFIINLFKRFLCLVWKELAHLPAHLVLVVPDPGGEEEDGERKEVDGGGMGGGAGGVGPEEGVDGFAGGLEGARGVQGEVAPVVRAACLLGELGGLGSGEEGAVPLAQLVQRGVGHAVVVICALPCLAFFLLVLLLCCYSTPFVVVVVVVAVVVVVVVVALPSIYIYIKSGVVVSLPSSFFGDVVR